MGEPILADRARQSAEPVQGDAAKWYGMLQEAQAECWKRGARIQELEAQRAAIPPAGEVPEAAQQNGGLVRAALIDLLALEKFTLGIMGHTFDSQRDATVRLAHARIALCAQQQAKAEGVACNDCGGTGKDYLGLCPNGCPVEPVPTRLHILNKAIGMYRAMVDSSGIHENRFPGWGELKLPEQEEWMAKARAVLATSAEGVANSEAMDDGIPDDILDRRADALIDNMDRAEQAARKAAPIADEAPDVSIPAPKIDASPERVDSISIGDDAFLEALDAYVGAVVNAPEDHERRMALRKAVLDARSPVAAPAECQTCSGHGIVGRPPDDYFFCPDCTPPVAAAERAGGLHDAELLQAADAVVERWHSKDWKQPHTADFINRLAAAVGAAKRAAASPPMQVAPSDEPVWWLEAEESARNAGPRDILGKHSMLYSTRFSRTKPTGSNPCWPLYLHPAAPVPQVAPEPSGELHQLREQNMLLLELFDAAGAISTVHARVKAGGEVAPEPASVRPGTAEAIEKLLASKREYYGSDGPTHALLNVLSVEIRALISKGATPSDDAITISHVCAALAEYYDALTARQHGGVAAGTALNKIERAMGMTWEDHKAAQRAKGGA